MIEPGGFGHSLGQMPTSRATSLFSLALASCLCSVTACDSLIPPLPGGQSDAQEDPKDSAASDGKTPDEGSGTSPDAEETSTGGSEDAGSSTGETPPDPDDVFEVVSSSLDRLAPQELTQTQSDAMRHGNVDLSFDLLDKHEFNTDNMAVSALSLRGAFGMVYAMARGETRDQIASSLGMDKDPEVALAALNNTDLALMSRNLPKEGDADPVIFSTANRVFLPSGVELDPNYLDDLAQYFGGAAYLGDFATNAPAILGSINAWVSERTRGLIPKLLTTRDVNSATNWVLVNAVYFKAPWSHEDRDEGRIEFTTFDGTTKEVDSVTMRDMRSSYGVEDGFSWASVPLRGRDIEFMVIVPEQGKFEKVRGELSGKRLDQMLENKQRGRIFVRYPKFKIESERMSMVSYLANRGMELPFTQADFSGALKSGESLSEISMVLQTCVVAVDEKGIEAAAATAVGSDESEKEIDFELDADKPFIFAVLDEPTGHILFSGQVLDPSAE